MSKEIEDLKLQITEMYTKILELENKEKEKKWWTPKEGDKYCFINAYGKISAWYLYNNDTTDKNVCNNLNYYKTREQAERKAFEQLLHRKLEKFAYKNNEEEIDWNNCNQNKYCLAYNNDKELLIECYSWTKQYNQVYFTSREIAEKCIEEFKDDLIRYFTTNE